MRCVPTIVPPHSDRGGRLSRLISSAQDVLCRLGGPQAAWRGLRPLSHLSSLDWAIPASHVVQCRPNVEVPRVPYRVAEERFSLVGDPVRRPGLLWRYRDDGCAVDSRWISAWPGRDPRRSCHPRRASRASDQSVGGRIRARVGAAFEIDTSFYRLKCTLSARLCCGCDIVPSPPRVAAQLTP
jgi:hypothetical protein